MTDAPSFEADVFLVLLVDTSKAQSFRWGATSEPELYVGCSVGVFGEERPTLSAKIWPFTIVRTSANTFDEALRALGKTLVDGPVSRALAWVLPLLDDRTRELLGYTVH